MMTDEISGLTCYTAGETRSVSQISPYSLYSALILTFFDHFKGSVVWEQTKVYCICSRVESHSVLLCESNKRKMEHFLTVLLLTVVTLIITTTGQHQYYTLSQEEKKYVDMAIVQRAIQDEGRTHELHVNSCRTRGKDPAFLGWS